MSERTVVQPCEDEFFRRGKVLEEVMALAEAELNGQSPLKLPLREPMAPERQPADGS